MICASAESSTVSALVAPAALEMSRLATAENELVLPPARANTSALAPVVVIWPLLLDNATVPVLIDESVAAPPVKVTPENDAVLVVPELLKSSTLTSRPSEVVNVKSFFEVEVVNDAVIPVEPEAPLMAAISSVRSLGLVTAAEMALPFKVIVTVPADTRLPSVALLVAVAVTPTLEALALMAAAMSFASARAA